MSDWRGVVFHPATLRTFLLICTASGVFVLFAVATSDHITTRKGLHAAAASGALAYGVALAAREMFRIRVDSEGIEGADTSGRRVACSWLDARSAVKVTVLGLGYVKVRPSSSGRTLWLPAYVDNLPELADAIAVAAGSDHVVAHAFRDAAERRLRASRR